MEKPVTRLYYSVNTLKEWGEN